MASILNNCKNKHTSPSGILALTTKEGWSEVWTKDPESGSSTLER